MRVEVRQGGLPMLGPLVQELANMLNNSAIESSRKSKTKKLGHTFGIVRK
jgi:hypothetical protein